MAFTIYNSTDASAPALTGLTGSLLTVLDAVLVNGYGTKPGAGWTKPLPNTSSYGMYKMGNGTTMSLFIYDAGSGSAVGVEALATGWRSISDIVGGSVTGSNPFPAYGQQPLGFGKAGEAGGMVIRKSTAPTAVTRSWTVFADSASMYLFTRPVDISGLTVDKYSGFFFGDIYSFKTGSMDISRCMIVGRINASSSAVADDRLDILNTGGLGITSLVTGHFMANFFNGTSASVAVAKFGDLNKTVNSAGFMGSAGSVPFLNTCDNGLYVSPIWVMDAAWSSVRGRMRGLWQICHVSNSAFTNGATFTASADFGSRTFQCVTATANLAFGTFLMETSDTLDTNNP